jgi:hypothetical protein
MYRYRFPMHRLSYCILTHISTITTKCIYSHEHVGPLYLEDSGLRYWGADNFFTGGTTFSITSVPIANTLDDTVYQSIRLGTFSYSILVPVGNYEADIHLAELYVLVVVEIQI